jgi:hypothetical protein
MTSYGCNFAYYKDMNRFKEAVKLTYAKVGASIANQNSNNILNRSFLRDIDGSFDAFIPTTYPNKAQLDRFIQKFDDFKGKIDTGGAVKKARIKFTEDSRNTFSFSLAAKGLRREIEYYSEELALNDPTKFSLMPLYSDDETIVAGIVPAVFTASIEVSGVTYFTYTDDVTGRKYDLRQQQKGTAKMIELEPTFKVLVGEDGIYRTEPTFSAKYKFSLKFYSVVKKSFLEYEKVGGGNAAAVDVYIPFDMVSGGVDTRMTPASPIIMAAEYLAKAKIKLRLNIMRIITTNREYQSRKPSGVTCVVVCIKDFNEPLDWEKMSILRGIENVGELITECNAYVMGNDNSSPIAISPYADYIVYDNEEMFQEYFYRFKNWLYGQVEQGILDVKLVEKPLMIGLSTGGLLGQSFITDNEPDRDDLIEEKFFEIIDSVNIFYNDDINSVVKLVMERYRKKYPNETEKEIAIRTKDYLRIMCNKIYNKYVPKDPVFESSDEEIEKMNKDFAQKFNQLNTATQKYGVL